MASVKPISTDLQKPALGIFDQNTIIWGQINRFFPIKIGLLTIAQYIEESGDEYNLVSMQDAIDHVKSSVRNIGEFLKQIDDKYGKKGPEKLSVGFASGDGLKLDKGLARFTSHFILRFRKTDKKMEGALVKLGFLRAYNMNGSGIKVGITESGLKFLNLSNPIVDSLAENESSIAIPKIPNKILSEEEKSFIIETIAELIPVDYKAMQTVLRLIDTGDNTQAKIQNGLQGNEDFGNGQAMIDTNKNGIIARLTALELIGRNKQSLNVEYYLTDAGKKIRSSK
jgi:predicted transcriptional regulator